MCLIQAVRWSALGDQGADQDVGVNIGSDSSAADVGERLRERLRIAMPPGGESSSGWPWYRYLEEHRDWGPLVFHLHEETEIAEDLMNYFSRRLVEIAVEVVPIIDQVLAADR